MKKILLSAALGLLGAACYAAPPVYEMPVVSQGTSVVVSVSTSAWTQLSSTTNGNLAGRTGVYVVNYSTNNASIALLFAASAPTEGLYAGMSEIQPGEWDVMPASKNTELWAVSYHTSAENIRVQEVKQ